MDRGACWVTVNEAADSATQLNYKQNTHTQSDLLNA